MVSAVVSTAVAPHLWAQRRHCAAKPTLTNSAASTVRARRGVGVEVDDGQAFLLDEAQACLQGYFLSEARDMLRQAKEARDAFRALPADDSVPLVDKHAYDHITADPIGLPEDGSVVGIPQKAPLHIDTRTGGEKPSGADESHPVGGVRRGDIVATANDLRRLQLEIVLCIKERRGEEAAVAALEFLELVPASAVDPVGIANIGVVFAVNKEWQRCAEVLSLVPKSHSIYAQQAVCWFAEALCHLGQPEDALEALRPVCRSYRPLPPPGTPSQFAYNKPSSEGFSFAAGSTPSCVVDEDVTRVKNFKIYGETLLLLGETEEAVSILDTAVRDGEQLLDEADVIVNYSRALLGIACLRRGDAPAAVLHLGIACGHLRERLAVADASLVQALRTLRAAAVKSERDDVAAQAAEDAVTAAEEAFGAGSAEHKAAVAERDQ